jgi:hypothetical protein|tara:strand:- start:14888 stop:15475 length:588 start_codon:yes stop_codon:yes gene_type:complete
MVEEVSLAESDNNDLGPAELAVVGTVIPYSRDDARAQYLSYLACGFAIKETLHLISKGPRWLERVRQDTKFTELESTIPTIRKELAKEYIELDFYRNYRLVLEKDHRVLWKSLNPDKIETVTVSGEIELVDAPMGRQDHEYLLKIRSQYNAQQLQIVEAIVSGVDNSGDFARWVSDHADIVQLSRTETITVQRGS